MMTRDDEIKEKESRVRDFLLANGLRAVLLKRQANFSWMTGGGVNAIGLATEIGGTSLLITENAKYVLSNNIEAPRMIQEEEVEKLGFHLKTFAWYEDLEAPILRSLVGKGLVACDVFLPDTRLMAEEIARLRYSLTPAEVDRYRWLGERASQAVERTGMKTRRGEKESEVVGRLCRELWKDRIDPVGLMVATDDRIRRFRHPIPTERTIDRFLMISVNARKGGLIVCLTRFVHFGKVPPALQKQYEANVCVDCTLMAHTRPGTPAREVLQKGLDAYREQGFPEEWKLHHQGGPIGYQPRDYRVHPETPDVIQENQGFTWNPSISGTKSEDTILATSDGPEMVTRPIIYPTISMEVAGIRFARAAILEKE
jgi:Xaa-Pro aminopeptidase